MVLDGKDRKITVGQTFDGFVVQIDVGHLGGALQGVRIQRETVVLCGNFYFPCGPVHYGLIAAVVSEFEFIGPAAQGQSQNLMS